MNNKKILVVDDDSAIRELLRVNLSEAGYDVKLVEDSTETLSRARQMAPGLIILDVMMPGMDGWELTKLIKDDDALKDTKIILLTAKAKEKDKMIGKDILKADEYVTKPFEIDKLLLTVEKLLNEK